jgi:hypothetical protein
MQPPAKWERIIRLTLLLVPQVKPWQLHTFPPILLVPQIMPYKLSTEPPALLMLTLPQPKSEIGSTNACLSWEKNSTPSCG